MSTSTHDTASELQRDIDACEAAVLDELQAERSDSSEIAPLHENVNSLIEQERGVIATLRALSTSRRIALVIGLATTVTLLALVVTPRPDMEIYPAPRLIVSLALLGLLTAAALWRLLRPLHQPAPAPWTGTVLLVAGVLAPVVMALVPLSLVDHGHPAGTGINFTISCCKCLGFGGVLGLPVLLLATLVRRARVAGAAIVALGGVAAGLTGNLTLQVHCPIIDPLHQLLGHASLLVFLMAIAIIWQRGKPTPSTGD